MCMFPKHWFHKWSKWSTVREGQLRSVLDSLDQLIQDTRLGNPISTVREQTRKCEHCELVETKVDTHYY